MTHRLDGFTLDVLSADPSSPEDGEVWCQGGRAKVREGGVTKLLTAWTPACTLAEGTAEQTTTSTSDVAMPGMLITPGAGTYLVISSCLLWNTLAVRYTIASIYANGVQQAASERPVQGSESTSVTSFAKITVADAQDIEVMWRVDGNTGHVTSRQLFLLKVL